MARSRFVVESNRFREFDRALENAIERALERGGEVGKAAAAAKPKRGYDIDGIVGSARVSRPRKGPKGLEIDIAWQDFRSLFFEKGTSRGIKPVRYMRAAALAGKKKLLELIQAEMRFR